MITKPTPGQSLDAIFAQDTIIQSKMDALLKRSGVKLVNFSKRRPDLFRQWADLHAQSQALTNQACEVVRQGVGHGR